MSFFDDDEPPTRPARPRRPAGPRAQGATTGTRVRSSGSGGGPPRDEAQQLMIRRAVALGVGVLVVILLLLGVKGCLDSRATNALKDYNRNVAAIVGDSNGQVSKRLFQLLSAGQTTQPVDLQQQVNQVRVTADEDVKRTAALDVPGAMKDAQYSLLEVLTLRSGAVQKIADALPDLSGTRSQDASSHIAGQMSVLLASDVVYSQRTIPYLQQGLASHDITGQPTTQSRSLPDTQWLDAGFVRKELTGKGSGRTSSGPPAPGTHGHGLLDVSVGTGTPVTLQPSPALNKVTGGSSPVFNVHFANQGENDEFDVGVRITVGTSGSGKPITVTKRVDQTTHGTDSTVQIPLGAAPPSTTPVPVTVEILPVKGEVNTTNNKQTYTVLFG